MTISPDGEPMPVEKRLAEIRDRYGPEHPRLRHSATLRTHHAGDQMTGPDAGVRRLTTAPRSMYVPPRLPSLSRMNTLTPSAQQLARTLLQMPLPRRWAHVQGVAARARGLAPVLGADACCPALKIPMWAVFTTPMKNRAIRAV
jgi:hypothetical protein